MKPTAHLANAVSSGRGKKIIGSLMEMLHMQARLEVNKPTFARFLGLLVSPQATTTSGGSTGKDVSTVRADCFSFPDASSPASKNGSTNQNSLVFRYRFPACDRLHHLHLHEDRPDAKTNTGDEQRGHCNDNSSPVSLSTYASILDEVTTYSIISATGPKRPRPGVSVTIQSQWGPAHTGATSGNGTAKSPEEIDIVTTLTKQGRNLAFVRAEVRDPNNNDGVICYFDHVKYLSVGWVLGLLLSPVGMWFVDFCWRYLVPYLGNSGKSRSATTTTIATSSSSSTQTGIMDSFRKTSDTTGTFRFGPEHANGFGGLHGGVQAILMERLGHAVAKRELGTATGADVNEDSGVDVDVECQRLQISYQSSASRQLDLRAHVIDPPRPDHRSITLRIEIVRSSTKPDAKGFSSSKKVVVSEGILTFAAVPTKAKVQ